MAKVIYKNIFTFYNIYIKTAPGELSKLYANLFTFYNIYIKTRYTCYFIYTFKNLHSTIFILKPHDRGSFTVNLFQFTFYNIYIKT